jgi:hypothetical protein
VKSAIYNQLNSGKMKGGDKHCKRGQFAMAVHYAAFMKRERRYFEDEM